MAQTLGLLSPSRFIVAAGFLQKPRGGVEAIVQGGWVERYFVLTKGALLYYHIVESDDQSPGTIFSADGELQIFDEKKMVQVHSIVSIRSTRPAEMAGQMGRGRASKHHHHFTVSYENQVNGAREDLIFRTTSARAAKLWIRALGRLTAQDSGPNRLTRWDEDEAARSHGSVDLAEGVDALPATPRSEVEQMRARLMALEQHIFSQSSQAGSLIAENGAPSSSSHLAAAAASGETAAAAADDDAEEQGGDEESAALYSISGFLQKRARTSALWQQRWVEVDGATLRYYHTGRQAPTLTIELNRSWSLHALEGDEYGFALTNGKNNLVFRVPQRRSGTQECRRWMQTLRRVIRSTAQSGDDEGSEADAEDSFTSNAASISSAHDTFIRHGKKFLSSAMKTFSVRGEDSLSASSAAASTSDAPSQRHSAVSTGGSVAHASPVTMGRELPSFAGNSDKGAASRGSILGAEEGVTHSGGSEVVTNPSELRAATGIVAMGFLDLKRSGVRGQVSEHSAKIMKTGVGKMMRDGAKKITAAVPILPGKSLRPTFDPDAAVQKMKWSRYLFVLSATGLHYYRTKNGRDALFKEHKGTILREDIAGMYVRSSVQAIDEDSSREGGSEPNSDRGEAAVVREEIITLKLKKMKWHEKMARAAYSKPGAIFETATAGEIMLRAPDAEKAHKWLEVLSGSSVVRRVPGADGEARLVPGESAGMSATGSPLAAAGSSTPQRTLLRAALDGELSLNGGAPSTPAPSIVASVINATSVSTLLTNRSTLAVTAWQLGATAVAFNCCMLALAMERNTMAAVLAVVVNARLTAHWWASANAATQQRCAKVGAGVVRASAPIAAASTAAVAPAVRRLFDPLANSSSVDAHDEAGAGESGAATKTAATEVGAAAAAVKAAAPTSRLSSHQRGPSGDVRDPAKRLKRTPDGRLKAGSMCMHDENGPMSWTDGVEGCDFQVRSRGYKDSSSPQYKEKISSLDPFYVLEGVDCTRTPTCVTEVGDKVELPEWFTAEAAARKASGEPSGPLPHMLVVNVALPLYSTWTGSQVDGPSAHMFMYFRLRDDAAKQQMDEDSAPPALQLLMRFFRLAAENRDAAPLLKIIMMVDDIESLGLPGMVSKYNGKPALQRSAQVLERDGYFEILINVHIWAQLVRSLWARYRGMFAGLHLRVGLLVEGNDETELPEQMMLAVAVHGMDWDAFPENVL